MLRASNFVGFGASRAEASRHLNDELRLHGRGGRITVTAGFAALPAKTQALAFRAIRTSDNFTTDDDPIKSTISALLSSRASGSSGRSTFTSAG